MRLSEKLGALCAAAALLPLTLAAVAALYLVSLGERGEAVRHLQADARAAAEIYEKRLVELRSAAQRLAEEIANRIAVNRDSAQADANAAARARLQDLIARSQTELGLDFVIVTNEQGGVIARHNDLPAPAETLLDPAGRNPLAERVISDGSQSRNSPVASAAIERGQQLVRLGLNLRAQVKRDSAVVEDALMLEAGAPIFGGGRFLGMVLIGQLLNNAYAESRAATPLHLPLVAEIRRALYGNEGRGAGALAALGDTIITSSVPAAEGERDSASGAVLIGALHDPNRAEETLQHGGQNFVAAWQPIKSLDGTPGAVGVAMPASEFGATTGRLRTWLLVIGLLALLISTAVGYLIGRGLGRRIDTLADAAKSMELGELNASVKDPSSSDPSWIPAALRRDEIARLAEQMDRMRESIKQALERMRKR